jgi:hypothetical protein
MKFINGNMYVISSVFLLFTLYFYMNLYLLTPAINVTGFLYKVNMFYCLMSYHKKLFHTSL